MSTWVNSTDLIVSLVHFLQIPIGMKLPSVQYYCIPAEPMIACHFFVSAQEYIKEVYKILIFLSVKVTPSTTQFTFHTERAVPKLGVMLVGWGGNNGTTVTAAVIANKMGMHWRTKTGMKVLCGDIMFRVNSTENELFCHTHKGSKKCDGMVWCNDYIIFYICYFWLSILDEKMYKIFQMIFQIIQTPRHFIGVMDVIKVNFPWNCP